jgi:general secretion pathway protein I
MKHAQHGLTLIEVLIALAIISIAMTAVIKATTQNIHSTYYLQKKTLALWVAEEVINESRANLLHIGDSSGNQKLTTEMLGHDWYWHKEEEETPNPNIKKIVVKVYEQDNDVEERSPLITLESYLYHETS